VLLVRRSLQKQENKNGTHRLTTDASRFLFYPVFPRILNNSWQVLPLRPQCFWAILLSQYRRRTGSGPCTRGRRLRPPKGDFVTKYLFQFARILAFCFLGEILHAVLPLPIPASVYGLILLLLALRLGIVKLEQVKEVGLFLTGIFPLLFVPAAAGVMELWAEMGNMLLPIIMYHEVKPNKSGKDAIQPWEFEADLKWLADNGYTTIVMADLIAYVRDGTPLPEKPIILSFDDGYYNNYVYVLPLLQQYSARIVLSLLGRNTDDFTEWPSESIDYAHVTWDQLNEMLDTGLVEVQNHSYNLHAYTSERHGCMQNRGESDAAYAELLRADLQRLQDELAEHTGRTPDTFAYPYGKYGDLTDTVLRDMGFQATLTCDWGVNHITRDPDCLYRLGRICRSHNQSLQSVLRRALKATA